MQQAVIRASPDHARLVRRFRQRVDRGVVLGADGVAVDRPARRLQRLGVGAGQIRADLLPGLALVSRLEYLVAADVNRVAVMRREDDRVGPGEAVFIGPRAQAGGAARPGGDQPDLLNAMVIALQAVAAARRTADGADVDDIGIVRINRDIAALARADDVAVFPGDGGIAAAAGHAQARIVLLRAIDVVGLVAVEIEMINLRRRLIVDARPGQPAVVRDASAAVIAVDHDLVVIADESTNRGHRRAAW